VGYKSRKIANAKEGSTYLLTEAPT